MSNYARVRVDAVANAIALIEKFEREAAEELQSTGSDELTQHGRDLAMARVVCFDWCRHQLGVALFGHDGYWRGSRG
jgi:hypothetical protein